MIHRLLNLFVIVAAFVLVPTTLAQEKSEAAEDVNEPFALEAVVKDIRRIQDEIATWDQSVRGFRRDHQFSLTAGAMNGTWLIKRFGTQINKSHSDSGYITKFQYSYHIPIYQSAGYFLGSSSGIWQVTEPSSQLKLQSAVMLPGVVAGFVYNFSPGLRAMVGIDYYLERWSGLHELDGDGEDPRISVTGRTTDLFISADIFYRLKWAVRVEAHRRQLDFYGAKKASGKAVDAVIARQDEWYGVGFLYHLM